ncbi:glutamine amidotransferase [compost metagenome]
MMHRWVVHGAHRFELPGAQMGKAHLDGRMQHDAPLRTWMENFLDLIFLQAGARKAA